MKRQLILFVVLVVALVTAIAQTQAQTSSPQEQLIQAQQRLFEVQQLQQQLIGGQQRGGGGRGVPAIGVVQAAPPVWNSPAGSTGAWWTDAALVQRLGLTDDQKTRIEAAYQNHRQQIISGTDGLAKEETQLTKLLEADPLDRNAVLAQIDRVNQARGDLERTNSLMTLEMREVLTRAQWTQLRPPQRVRVGANVMNNNLISRVEPVFPAGSQGAVVLEVQISKEGVVESVNMSSGSPAMAQAAHDAVMQWRYKPTLLNGQPVAAITTVTFGSPAGSGQRTIRTPFGDAVVPGPQ